MDKEGIFKTSITEILTHDINITANIFLNNVLKFVNTYIQLIKHHFKVRKSRLYINITENWTQIISWN